MSEYNKIVCSMLLIGALLVGSLMWVSGTPHKAGYDWASHGWSIQLP